MKVPLLDLKKQYEEIKDEVNIVVQEVFESQYFILGPKVEAFEKRIAEYCQCDYAVGVSSGSDALLISLMAAGIESGDYVLTTPYSFFATAGCVSRLDAIPVFADIDPKTYNLDPGKLGARLSQFDKKERDRVKAIIPVHLYGQCADMAPILDIATEHNLTVIEDAAQSIGSEYRFSQGGIKRRAGSMGDYGCFSFFPSKNLGAFGDAGMVTTNSETIYENLKLLRVHGGKPKYYYRVVGGNFRLDALQAAVLSVKLEYLDGWTERRRENARLYRKLFEEAGIEHIELPLEKEERHIYNQFIIKVKDKRDELRTFLNEKEIGTEIYYPVALHAQDCFKYLGYKPEDFPVSMDAASRTLALPVYPELTKDQIAFVVEMIAEYSETA